MPFCFHGFLPPAGNHATSLGGVGALTSSSELSGDNLVDQRDVSLDILGGNAEESLRSFNGAGGPGPWRR